MAHGTSSLASNRILKRQVQKLEEEIKQLRQREKELRSTVKRVIALNKTERQKRRRAELRAQCAETKVQEYRATQPQYPCVKKKNMPPLAYKHQSALVVNGD
jgi:ribosomal protein L17